MNPSPLDDALSELREASEALWRALRNGEPQEMADAMARRESVFSDVVGAAGSPSARARALLAEVQRGDCEALRAAQEWLGTLRLELEELRQARAALAHMRAPEKLPRFVSKRV